jgi:hypothetical protein
VSDVANSARQFSVRIGDVGVLSNHGANRRNSRILAEVVRFHDSSDLHHVIAFIEDTGEHEYPDVRFCGRRPFDEDWPTFRYLCELGISLIQRSAPPPPPPAADGGRDGEG